MIDSSTQSPPTEFTTRDIDRRVAFLASAETMEIDLGQVHFRTSADVNAVYDRLEELIAESGEDLWFFLVNYSGCRIDPAAWVTFSRRGKTLNLAHSMGSVRVDASEETRAQIERDAGTEAFDPNLFASREAALARIAGMKSRRIEKIVHEPNYTEAEIARRIGFDVAERIMEADFSDFVFHHSRDVNDVYDLIEKKIRATDRKWYFLVNYNGCRIMPEAWVQYARRGKELNVAASLGSVRYAAGLETEADIRMRAESQGFRPNIRNTREEALERIAEMKAEAAAT